MPLTDIPPKNIRKPQCSHFIPPENKNTQVFWGLWKGPLAKNVLNGFLIIFEFSCKSLSKLARQIFYIMIHTQCLL